MGMQTSRIWIKTESLGYFLSVVSGIVCSQEAPSISTEIILMAVFWQAWNAGEIEYFWFDKNRKMSLSIVGMTRIAFQDNIVLVNCQDLCNSN